MFRVNFNIGYDVQFFAEFAFERMDLGAALISTEMITKTKMTFVIDDLKNGMWPSLRVAL